VYGFDDLDAAQAACDGDWEAVRGLLGGKGANLADMVDLGVPVPPGFTITTEACVAYTSSGSASSSTRALPDGLWDDVVADVGCVEAQLGRTGKRTAQAAVRIAVELANEGLITRGEAVQRVTPEQVDVFLHPQFLATDLADRTPAAKGLNVSPGAAVGQVCFDPDLAVKWAGEGRAVLLVRHETKPDDVHGMLAAVGILTSAGGRTSLAALVARQFGKPAVTGAVDIAIDLAGRSFTVDGTEVQEGEWVSIDGTHGDIYLGQVGTEDPDLDNEWLSTLLSWADDVRTLGVRANADDPVEAARARSYGAVASACVGPSTCSSPRTGSPSSSR